MSPQARKAYVVSHTHWDREWYLPFHRFRVNLVRVVDAVLDALENDESFEHFLLDGQCVAIEDYLEARPEQAGRVAALVRGGALSIGPWYVLPDEFLVSGEATVRNLLLGHAVAGAIGQVQKVGYMPDSFGHIAQMPQILRRAGIDSFVYTRGNGDELEELGLEYTWRAPDGSEVLAVNQCGGYCNAAGLGFEEMWHAFTRRDVDARRAVEQIGGLLDRMGQRANCDALLLNNGCDHHPPAAGVRDGPQEPAGGVPRSRVRARQPLSDYVAAVRESGAAEGVYEGEMLGGRYHHILSGVWSARMRLKQQNDAAQTLLAGYVEPVAAYSHFMHGRPYPHGLIDYSWKLLMKNHPHDSICGCSTDEVHREMEPRFAGVRDTGEQLLSAELEHLAPAFARRAEDDAETVICVVNPLPFERTEVIERLVVFQPPGIDSHTLHLCDEDGASVPFTIVSKRYVERFWAIDYRGELFSGRQGDLFRKYLNHFGDRIVRTEEQRNESDCFLTVQFVARKLPALGHANYYFRQTGADGDEASRRPPSVWAVRVVGNSIENGLVRVTLNHNGTFDVEDKLSGRAYSGLNVYEDTEDTGDEYDYCRAANSMTLTSADTYGDIRAVEDTGLSATLEVRYDLHIPSALEKNRDHRRPDTVACRTTTRIRLKTGSPIVEVEVEFENRARDHRLRAIFPTPVVTGTLFSDGHFLVNERPIEKPDGTGWVQPPPTTYPQQEYSLVTDGDAGIAVLNQGLPEIEATRNDDGEATLALTLLRCVGWLSRDDFDSRKRCNAGPTIHTPEAQCLGPQAFRYAVLPISGGHLESGVKERSLRYRTPVLTKQGVRDQCVPGGPGLLEKQSAATCITAVKKHQSRDTLVVRVCNLSSEVVEETLMLGRAVKSAWRVDLLEERLERFDTKDKRVVGLVIDPHEIESIELEFEATEQHTREEPQ